MKFISQAKPLIVLWVALFLSSCEYHSVSNTPEPVEPNTARSVVSAMINGQRWEVRTPDTLSKGSIPATGAYAGTIVRTYPVVNASVICGYSNDIPRYIIIEIKKPFHLSSRDFINQNNVVDALRTWDEDELSFLFRIPENITFPSLLAPDTLIVFHWARIKTEEYYLPDGTKGNPNRWSVFAIPAYTTFIGYAKYIDSTQQDYHLYSSKVERAQLNIDSYDLVKRRVSGRFSFRVIGSLNKEVIEIQDGKFENVRF